ncbi:MAG TPA: ComEC/Rec2 family competence protein [Clostridia bacterium]|nr:ComEC/Rec2 family competence protein [Clostridia bacterium]HPY42938.1 ComEC/Rec2 family competence protein [Clostridia bacterium]HQA97201.1 ComEC/Rec2 family competence protein [Clostridia bacterium]
MNPRAFFAQRPLVCLAAAYAAGIPLGAWPAEFTPWLALAGILLGGAAALLLRARPALRAVSGILCFLFMGALLGGLAAHPPLPAEGDYRVHARVIGQSAWSEDGLRIKSLLGDVQLADENGQTAFLPKAYWTYYAQADEPLPQDGQRLSFSARLYHPQGRVNPYGFDFKDYLLQRGIPAGLSGAKELVFTDPVLTRPQSFWLRVRTSLAERLDALFGAEHGALAKALLLGVRDSLAEEITTDFRTAGIAHILAVSGLHVGFLAAGVMAVLRRFSPSPRALAILLGGMLLAYCRLLDFSASIVRASILTMLLLSGKALRCRVDPLTSLAAAMLLILLFRPLDLFNLGFQLSFLAVFGIITLGDRLQSRAAGKAWFKRLPAPAQKALQAYFVTLSASLMTLVPLANAFHRVSLIGLVISPVAIAGIGLVMGLFAAGLLLSYLWLPLARWLALPTGLISGAYQTGVSLAAGAPLAQVRLRALPAAWFLPYYALLWLLSRYGALRRKPRQILSGLLAAALVALPVIKTPQPLTYVQLSTGDSDCALLLDGEYTWVIDAGKHGGDLASYLLSEGRDVDRLILTHLHNDHAGGLRQLLEAGIRIGEILMPDGARDTAISDESLQTVLQAQAAGIPVNTLARGQALQEGRVTGRVLWPYENGLYPGMNPNRSSLVIYWELNGTSLLTTGDLHPDYAPYAYTGAQVLKVPHHGSRDDNSPAALGMVCPQIALITASGLRPQRYQAAAQRLEAMGARVFLTGQAGAITLVFEQAGSPRLSTYLPGRD